MKKRNKYHEIRARYQAKRRTNQYKSRRIRRLLRRRLFWSDPYAWSRIEPKSIQAPPDFSLIKEPDKFVTYLKTIKKESEFGHPILIDISQIETITYETIPVILSYIKQKKFLHNATIHGNAPNNPRLRKLFTESGFYDYVQSRKKFNNTKENLLHQESNFKVKPEIAGRVTDLIEEVFEYNITDDEIEAIYNIFIELMSNTHHHADEKKYGQTKWWLYAHCDKEEINITFLDLGVGIFKSTVVKEKVKKMGLNLKLISNLILVDDLLDGKIQSRIDVDNEIRGKGLPQILEYAKLDVFESFVLVTNDTWINLKDRSRKKISKNFRGTLFNFTVKTN